MSQDQDYRKLAMLSMAMLRGPHTGSLGDCLLGYLWLREANKTLAPGPASPGWTVYRLRPHPDNI